MQGDLQGEEPAEFKLSSQHLACPSCDSLIDTSELVDGDTATCPVCRGFLTKFTSDGVSRVISYATSALILLVFSCAFPFLSFKASGLESVMTLPGTAIMLYTHGMTDLALLVGAFILFIPSLIMVLLLLFYIPLKLEIASPWLVFAGRSVFALQHWCMVDVFLIGVIVSLVKIVSMATIILGISFFAYVGFAICFTLALTNTDRLQCWLAVERVAGNQF